MYPYGTLCIRGRQHEPHLSTALAGLPVGRREDDDGLWLVQLGTRETAMYDAQDRALKAMAQAGLTEYPPNGAKR